jgi:hypothetical protein
MNEQQKAAKREYARQWRLNNPDKVALYESRTVRAPVPPMTPEQRAARKEYNRQWQKANRDRVRAYRNMTADQRNARRRQRYAEDPTYREEMKAQVREYQIRTRTKVSRAAQKYKVDPYELELMMNKGCAACHAHPDFDPKVRMHVDHDHETGVVRGVLCQPCNLALGHLHDDPLRIMALFDYVMAASRGSSGVDSTTSRMDSHVF